MEMKMNKKILITGGCGYIGSRLVDLLMNPEVTVADSKVYGQGGNSNYGDFSKIPDVDKYDVIIHLAATTNGVDCESDQNACMDNNVVKTFELARRCKPDVRFIFASSSAIYGDAGGNLPEPYSCNTGSWYALTKYFCERGLRLLVDNLVCVRLGTVWGVSRFMRPHLLVHDMVRQAVQTGQVEVMHGFTRRPFVHVDDVAKNLKKLIDLDIVGVIDFGTEVMSKYDLADLIQKQTGCKIVPGKFQAEIQDFSIPKTYPGLELEYGIKELIAYYETQPDHPDPVAH